MPMNMMMRYFLRLVTDGLRQRTQNTFVLRTLSGLDLPRQDEKDFGESF